VLVLNSGCCCCLDSGLPRSSPRKSRKTGWSFSAITRVIVEACNMRPQSSSHVRHGCDLRRRLLCKCKKKTSCCVGIELTTEVFCLIPPQRKQQMPDARFALENLQSQKNDDDHVTVILKAGMKANEGEDGETERRCKPRQTAFLLTRDTRQDNKTK
jgi:hypothetical protein